MRRVKIQLIACLPLTFGGLFWPSLLSANTLPPLMLAAQYQQQDNLSDYWVSEKLDGVRAYWDGERLYTRQGHPINAPEWFTHRLPPIPLDGELWLGRGRFAELSGIVRTQHPDHQAWQSVRYQLFDLPSQLSTFDQRLADLKHLTEQLDLPWLNVVAHEKFANHQALQQRLEQLSQAGAEGLMLHRGSAYHQLGRSDDLLKYKLYEDTEAVIIGYSQGQGQFSGLMGALVVRLNDGKTFKIGSGFSLQERQNPPAIGQTITFRYNGKTANGLPRFARFMRVREE